MMILNGRELAQKIRSKVEAMIKTLPSQPGMAAILVGDDPASHLYVSLKEKACRDVGIRFEKYLYPADEPQVHLISRVQELNDREDIHGILVQLPLPTQSADAVIAAIDPNKDIDGFHPENLRRLEAGEPSLVSPVALGVMRLIDIALEAHGGDLSGARAVIVSSDIFARPLVALLGDAGASTVVAKADDADLCEITREADVLITAVGRPGLITAEMTQQDVIAIDVGTTKTADGIVGDIDFPSVSQIASAITPVPGGVGPVTVAMLMLNVVKAYRMKKTKS